MINTPLEASQHRISTRTWFIVWLALWTIVGVGLAVATVPKAGGEAIAYVYGGVFLGSTGGAVYAWLWRRQAGRSQRAPSVSVGGVFGLLASAPYIVGQTAIEVFLTHTPPSPWQDLEIVLASIVIGAVCAAIDHRRDVRQPTA